MLLSFPDNQSFIFLQKRKRFEKFVREVFEVMRDFLESTLGAHVLGTFCGFPTSPKWCGGTAFPLSLRVCIGVCTCAFVCIYLCAGTARNKMGDGEFRPEEGYTWACRGGSYANNLLLKLCFFFFIYYGFISKSNISSAFHMYLFTLFTVVFVRSPISCFCGGALLPLIYLSFYSQNSS